MGDPEPDRINQWHRRFDEASEAMSEIAPDPRIMPVHHSAPIQELFRGREATPEWSRVTKWTRRGETHIGEVLLHLADAVEGVADEIGAVHLDHHSSVVAEDDAEDSVDTSSVEDHRVERLAKNAHAEVVQQTKNRPWLGCTEQSILER
jgi:hypothetical protein